jgi:hypothetical protein
MDGEVVRRGDHSLAVGGLLMATLQDHCRKTLGVRCCMLLRAGLAAGAMVLAWPLYRPPVP